MTAAMPALSPRSEEILESIRSTFAEKGFDGASMQDLARAAGMSVGNFYRYFPSKAAIVEAFVTRDLAEVEQDFAAILGSDDPMQSLRDILRYRVEVKLCKEDYPLWAEITAAAMRKPEIGSVCGRMEAEIVDYLLAVFAHATGLSQAETARRFHAHAAFVVMLVKSRATEPPEQRRGQTELTALLLRTINATLDEVAACKSKG